MSKRKILFCGEASFLSTGFARFQKEIIERIHATGKFEIAEMGSYASSNDIKTKNMPWKFYGVLPLNEHEKDIYNSNKINEFGRYKLDAVLADFQPDIVFDARDPWMIAHLVGSKYRSLYKLVLMPTVDSAPQKKEWIREIFSKADVLTTYSRFGKRTLEAEGLKVADVTSPCVDLELFKPLAKEAVRDKFGIFNTLFVFGTVMRNQKRKLFPDLFDAYKALRDKYAVKQKIQRIKERQQAGKKLSTDEINALRVDHSVLYCHTSWPEQHGWDLPEYLGRTQLQRHVIFTYKCEACKFVYASWFTPCNAQGLSVCRKCGKQAAHMPNTHHGINEKELAEIYNLFDVYVHPAICEGWGLPIMESKSCGVPGLYQNYSAMEDHVQNGGGLEIKVGQFYHEQETGSIRSLPDVEDMTKKMELLAFDSKKREKLAIEARKCAEEVHDWSITANKLVKIFEGLELSPREQRWNKPPKLEYLNPARPPQGLNDQDFVAWLYFNILKRAPDEKGLQDWLKSLASGNASRDSVEKFFRDEISNGNMLETVRWEKSQILRGIEPTKQVKVKNTNNLPGALV